MPTWPLSHFYDPSLAGSQLAGAEIVSSSGDYPLVKNCVPGSGATQPWAVGN